jgi:uncharacterized protein (DUF58 family)
MKNFTLADIYSSIERVENVIPVENLSNYIRFGEHKSFLRDGHDFGQVKEYDPEEDSIFEIIWSSVRPNTKPLVRKTIATKEFIGMILGDVSPSMLIGADYQFKARLLLEVIGDVGMTCSHGNDPMGFIGFGQDILFDEMPRVGQDNIDYIIEQVYNFFESVSPNGKKKPYRGITDYDKAFKFFAEKYVNKECFLVVVSDFIGAEEIVNSQILKNIANQHEVVFIFLDDKSEFEASSGVGYIRLENAETGKQSKVSRRKMEEYYLETRQKRKQMRDTLNDIGIDCMVLEYGKQFQRLSRIFMARGESFRM